MRIVYLDATNNIRQLLDDKQIDQLKQYAQFDIFEGRPQTTDEYIERIGNADAILLEWGIENDVLAACPNLKAIAFIGYGVKNYIDLSFATSHQIKVMNTPGYGDNAVAEHALALLFSLVKNITNNDAGIRVGKWYQESPNIEVLGKTIGLIGLGGIGARMAQLCNALGMNVICWTFNPDEQRSRELGVTFVELETLLQQSDFVSLHLPFTDETKEMLGHKELSMMKQGSLLINTARSELINTNALIEHLKNGPLLGAGLDVFDEEPVLLDNPLLSLDNVILTPHVGYNTTDAIINMLEISINNLVSFAQGNPKNVVNNS